jgi:hypothetical protein
MSTFLAQQFHEIQGSWNLPLEKGTYVAAAGASEAPAILLTRISAAPDDPSFFASGCMFVSELKQKPLVILELNV